MSTWPSGPFHRRMTGGADAEAGRRSHVGHVHGAHVHALHGPLDTAAEAAAGHDDGVRLHLDRLYLRSDPFVVEDHLGTVGRLRQWALAVAEEAARPPLIIVDYLQRMRPPEAERRLDLHRQISMAGLGLRQLARDLSSPVLAISSVNRQSYDKPASLDAFKGSGDLEYDADVCILLRFAASSDEEAKAMAEASGVVPVALSLVGKNRYGPTNAEDPIRLDFDRSYGSFRELHVAPARTAASASHPNPPANPPPCTASDEDGGSPAKGFLSARAASPARSGACRAHSGLATGGGTIAVRSATTGTPLDSARRSRRRPRGPPSTRGSIHGMTRAWCIKPSGPPLPTRRPRTPFAQRSGGRHASTWRGHRVRADELRRRGVSGRCRRTGGR
ncbi:MAG: DnaB-like helicase C-terminal domain-containing protein [Acidimicrobiales bacterium]